LLLEANLGQFDAMPRYFFDIYNGRSDPDESGTELADDDAARSYAERTIGELKEAGGYDHPALVMIVKNQNGKILFSVPFGRRDKAI
jgi:hypothetical protein